MHTKSTTSRRIFLTGATGSMGLAATRALIDGGHEVAGVARGPAGAGALSDLGATPIEVDLFDRDAVRRAMAGCDVVAHFATSIPTGSDATKAKAWQLNDELRSAGTANLIAAAEAIGVERFIFESIALAYPDGGDGWIDESIGLDPVAPMMRSAVEAEAMVARFGAGDREAVSLRFGRLYGPGRASAAMIEAIRERQMPIVGGGRNYVSSIHVDDVGSAIEAALDAPSGAYNVVDDEPLTQREWMSAAVAAVDAPQPRRVPYPLARLVAGKAAHVLKVSHRVSSRRFRDATGWAPRHPSAAGGWAMLGAGAGAPVAAAS